MDRAQEDRIDNWFTHHPVSPEQVDHYQIIRAEGARFAKIIAMHTPLSADQTAAIRKVREAVMTANAAIACKGQ
jgi:hypothetical protein